MWKALLKKQFLELNRTYFYNAKTGKQRSKAGTVGFIALMLLVFVCLAFVFFMAGVRLAEPLHAMGLDWLYFAMIGLVAIALGVFGSVFNTYAGLYCAKDNELLLSLPIPSAKILGARMLGVFAMGLLYEGLVFVPALAAYWVSLDGASAASVVCSALMTMVLAFLVLTLTCALGYVVALIANRLRSKSFMTVLLSILFLGGYYYVYFNFNDMLSGLLTNAAGAEHALRTWGYPAYLMGMACTGDVLAMAAYTAAVLVLTALCYWIMSRSFLRIATTKRGEKKAVYREQAAKSTSVSRALLRREIKRFTASPVYMMNTSLGTLLYPVGAVLLVVKAQVIRDALLAFAVMFPELYDMLPVIAAAAVIMVLSMNNVSAPSVSLEGKSLWIAQTLPVEPYPILQAKLRLHELMTGPAILLLSAALCWTLRLDVSDALLLCAVVYAFMEVYARLGLVLNLKNPNLHWTNETGPVKQNTTSLLLLFGGWALSVALAALCYLLREHLTANQMLLVTLLLFTLPIRLLDKWLRTRGSDIYAHLT